MDREAMDKARGFHLPLFHSFLEKGKSQLGYMTTKILDETESRHLMMCTLLFGNLGLKYNHIIQMGGDFGNWPRLCENIVDYKKWTIIDSSDKIELQKWFLEQELKSDYDKIEFVSINDYPKWKKNLKNADLSISAHFLGELPMRYFKEYYESIIMKCKGLFFATCRNKLNVDLIQKKLILINENFSPLGTVYIKNETITNTIFKHK